MTAIKSFAFIGPRAAGKSRLSRKFAKRIDWVLFSTDTLVSYEAGGLSPKEIVTKEGWPGFRKRETEVLIKVAPMKRVVIDCGGGILVSTDENEAEVVSTIKADLLRSNCTTIYIKRDIDWLLSREAESNHRPSLSADYKSVLKKRLPWYEQAADYTLDLSKRDASEGLAELLDRFSSLVVQPLLP